MARCYNCPFLKGEHNGRISCEAAMIKPPDQQAHRDILYKYCAHPKNYKECTLYKVLQDHYKRKYDTKS